MSKPQRCDQAAPRNQVRRFSYARLTIALCLTLAIGSVVLNADRPATLAADAPFEQADCVPAGSQGIGNWGVAPAIVCDAETNAERPVSNWGSTRGAVAQQDAKPEALDETLGQAAGEIVVLPETLPGACASLECPPSGGQPGSTCASLDCEDDDTTVGVCASLDCPGNNSGEIACTSLMCDAVAPAATVTTVEVAPIGVELGPKWALVVQWLPDILAAQQQVFAKYGVLVPTNVIMAEIMIESQGQMPSGANYAGAVGLLQVTPYSWGASGYDLKRAETDAAYSIFIGVSELALRYLDSKNHNTDRPGEPLPWENVIVGFFSGHYVPDGSSDRYNSDIQYQKMFREYYAELEAAGGAFVGRSTGSTKAVIPTKWLAAVSLPIKGLSGLWSRAGEQQDWPVSQEFGPTDFSIYTHPEWYSYSLQYGFEQPGHTGLDIAMPAGTPLYAPYDSEVYCAGTGNSYFPDEGCSAFLAASGGPTSGRLQLRLLPSGDMLIYGHVKSSVVVPGQKVKAGQLIGYSGGFNGDHLHLEYRTLDPTTTARWRIVDPRLTPLNGRQIPSSAFTGDPTPTVTVTAEATTRATLEPTPRVTAAVTPETVTATIQTETVVPETVTPEAGATEAAPTEQSADPPPGETVQASSAGDSDG